MYSELQKVKQHIFGLDTNIFTNNQCDISSVFRDRRFQIEKVTI